MVTNTGCYYNTALQGRLGSGFEMSSFCFAFKSQVCMANANVFCNGEHILVMIEITFCVKDKKLSIKQ